MVAARICTILKAKGSLEADAIAEAAMVPAKDTREVSVALYWVMILFYVFYFAILTPDMPSSCTDCTERTISIFST